MVAARHRTHELADLVQRSAGSRRTLAYALGQSRAQLDFWRHYLELRIIGTGTAARLDTFVDDRFRRFR